ncbi:uncharacterized protein LOC116412647 [Galleria mellonella]|uniref:Uncharacterized protein LOC116412647 n=1 Tax=Galleria mellonella TaxID=7137 RepID=A0A6J3BNH2_GALME|nr:uncharacterized protein LOC116412647 [Galleria mellonella]
MKIIWFYAITAATIITAEQVQEKSDGINKILDNLMKQTENNNYGNYDLNHNLTIKSKGKSGNNSKIIYIKPNIKSRDKNSDEPKNNSIENFDKNAFKDFRRLKQSQEYSEESGNNNKNIDKDILKQKILFEDNDNSTIRTTDYVLSLFDPEALSKLDSDKLTRMGSEELSSLIDTKARSGSPDEDYLFNYEEIITEKKTISTRN